MSIRYLNGWVARLSRKVSALNKNFYSPDLALLQTKLFQPGTKLDYPPYLPVWLGLILGVGLSVLATGMVYKWEETRTKEQFPKKADNLALALQQQLDQYLQVCRGLSALYNSSQHVNREEFAEFSQTLLEGNRYPAVLELGWAKQVLADQRTAYEQAMSKEGLPSFQILERNQAGEMVSALPRPQYFPKTYIRVNQPVEPLLGYDQASELARRLAINKAQRLGIMVASQPFSLGSSDRSVFATYHAITKPKLAESGVNQQPSLQGLVYAVYNIENLIKMSLNALHRDGFDLYLYDLPIDQLKSSLGKGLDKFKQRFLLSYQHRSERVVTEYPQEKSIIKTKLGQGFRYCPYSEDETVCIRTLNVADREWSILLIPTPIWKAIATRLATTLALGLLSTSCLVIYLSMSVKRNLQTQELNSQMRAELEIARQLQKMILPKEKELTQIPGLEIAGFMEPATEIGGDYYDVLKHKDQVKIAIGDVTGHGLESGVLMIMLQTAVRTLLANQETNPVQFLSVVNEVIYQNVQRMGSQKNLTLSLLDYQQGQLYLSGQHEEMIIVRSDGKIERIDTIDLGFPIGLEPDIAHFVGEAGVKLNRGDVVVLYTDGITEAINISGLQYGTKQLCQTVKRNRHLSAEQIKQAVINEVWYHIGEQKVYDDITLLVLKQK